MRLVCVALLALCAAFVSGNAVKHQACADEPFDCRVGPTSLISHYYIAYSSDLVLGVPIMNNWETCDALCAEWKSFGKWRNRVGYECAGLPFEPEFYVMNSVLPDVARKAEHDAILAEFDSVDNPYHYGAACRHYLDFGQALGLPSSECDWHDFECNTYLAQNADVHHLIGNDCAKACQHYLNRGRLEGRVASNCHSEPFDCAFYRASTGANPNRKCSELCDEYLGQVERPQAMECAASEFDCGEYEQLYPGVTDEVLELKKQQDDPGQVLPVRDFVTRALTWPQGQRACASKGMRLCTSWEVCPFGNGSMPVHGIAFSPVFGGGAPDQWVPIGETFNGWVQVGLREDKVPVCTKHEDHFYTPDWGTQASPNAWRGLVYCCPSPNPPPRKLTTAVVEYELGERPTKVHRRYRGAEVSWSTAEAMCSEEGRRMCTRDEICPKHSVFGKRNEPLYGYAYAPDGSMNDMWAPFATANGQQDNWVQVSNREGWQCKSHREMTGQTFFTTPGVSQSYKGWIYCCDGEIPDTTRIDLRPTTGHSMTWHQAQTECDARGMTMCSAGQVCPGGYALNNPNLVPRHGKEVGDVWVPIANSLNDWIQVGDHSGGTCAPHSWAYGYPSWGLETTSLPHRGVLYCCERGTSGTFKPVNNVQLIRTVESPALTWTETFDLCQSRGQRLCSRDEICYRRWDGQWFPKWGEPQDTWVAADGYNKWVQIGSVDSRKCNLHDFDWYDLEFGTPSWGQQQAAMPWRGIVQCCKDSMQFDDMSTFEELRLIERKPEPTRYKWDALYSAPSFSRADAQAHCNAQPGMRMCKPAELCRHGFPWGGVLNFDSWTVVDDPPLGLRWLQLGVHSVHDACSVHDGWYVTDDNTVAYSYKDFLYCCPIDETSPDTGLLNVAVEPQATCSDRCANYRAVNEQRALANAGTAAVTQLRAGRHTAASEQDCAGTEFVCESYRASVAWEAQSWDCAQLCSHFLWSREQLQQAEIDHNAAGDPFDCDYARAAQGLDASLSCYEVYQQSKQLPGKLLHPIQEVTAWDCAINRAGRTGTCTELADEWLAQWGDSPASAYPANTGACAVLNVNWDCAAYIAHYADVRDAAHGSCPAACANYLVEQGRLPIAPPAEKIAIRCPAGDVRTTCDGALVRLEAAIAAELTDTLVPSSPAPGEPLYEEWGQWCAAADAFTPLVTAANRAEYAACIEANDAWEAALPAPPTVGEVTLGDPQGCDSGYWPVWTSGWLCAQAPTAADVENYPFIPAGLETTPARIAYVSSALDGARSVVSEVMGALQRPFWLRYLGVPPPPAQQTPALPQFSVSLGSYVTRSGGGNEAMPLNPETSFVVVDMQQESIAYELGGLSVEITSPATSTVSNVDFTFVMSMDDQLVAPDWALRLHGASIPVFPPIELVGVGFSVAGNFNTSTSLEMWNGEGDPHRDTEASAATWQKYSVTGGHVWYELTAAGKSKRAPFLEVSVDCPVLLRAVGSDPAEILVSGRPVGYEMVVPSGSGSVSLEKAEGHAVLSFNFAEFSAYGMLNSGESRCMMAGELQSNPFAGTPFAFLFPLAPSAHVDGSMQPCPWGSAGYTNKMVAITQGVDYTFLLQARLGPLEFGWSWRAKAGVRGLDVGAYGSLAPNELQNFAGHLEFALHAALDAVRGVLVGIRDANNVVWNGLSAAFDAAGSAISAAQSQLASGCNALGNCQVPCGAKKRSVVSGMQEAEVGTVAPEHVPEAVEKMARARAARSALATHEVEHWGIPGIRIPSIPIPIPGIPDIPGATIPGVPIPIPPNPLPGIEDLYNEVGSLAVKVVDTVASTAVYVAGQICDGGNRVTDFACEGICTGAQQTLKAMNTVQEGTNDAIQRLNVINAALTEAINLIDDLKAELDFSSAEVYLKQVFSNVRLRNAADEVSAEIGVVVHVSGDDHTYSVRADPGADMQDLVTDVVLAILRELISVVDVIPFDIGVDVSDIIVDTVRSAVP